jgi:glycosyltransferase involved in cell wall biosynthesis
MYFNKVSIVSDTSSLPEVVGNAGIVQNYNDIQLLADNLQHLLHEADKYKTNIVTQLCKFDANTQIEKFKELILSNYK